MLVASISRRSLLLGTSALGVAMVARAAGARGRTPIGGRITLRVPWPLGSIDPHRLDDATCAIFGDALFDTLYLREESGAVVPGLAESGPETVGADLRITLRQGLKTAAGRTIEARDVAFS